jgi:hypothetical protein
MTKKEKLLINASKFLVTNDDLQMLTEFQAEVRDEEAKKGTTPHCKQDIDLAIMELTEQLEIEAIKREEEEDLELCSI